MVAVFVAKIGDMSRELSDAGDLLVHIKLVKKVFKSPPQVVIFVAAKIRNMSRDRMVVDCYMISYMVLRSIIENIYIESPRGTRPKLTEDN